MVCCKRALVAHEQLHLHLQYLLPSRLANLHCDHQQSPRVNRVVNPRHNLLLRRLHLYQRRSLRRFLVEIQVQHLPWFLLQFPLRRLLRNLRHSLQRSLRSLLFLIRLLLLLVNLRASL